MIRAILLLLVLATPAMAAPVRSDDAACMRLKQMLLPRIRPGRLTDVNWRCDIDHESGIYVIGLHADHPCPVTCSTLFGWFAVRKRDGRVGEWDINQPKMVRLGALY